MARGLARKITLPLVLLVPGCVSELPLDDRPCPCVEGWHCCRTDNTCWPPGVDCPGGTPCEEGCRSDQYCLAETCFSCADNKHCGAVCRDCTALADNWACLQGFCGCRSQTDCSVAMDCVQSTCTRAAADAGTEDGGEDGGATDSGASGHNSKCCGSDCTDCTGQASNWACLWDRCGCLDASDCPANLACLNGSCAPLDEADGGVED